MKFLFGILNFNILNAGKTGAEQPFCEPWTLVPIITILFGLIFIIASGFAGFYLKKKEKDNIFKWSVFGVAVVFLILEIVHEVERYYYFGFYDYSSFPFQFCTTHLFLGLAIPFIKNKKVREPFLYFFAIFGFVSGIFPLLFGQGQLCRWTNLWGVLRSFIWHILILMLSVFSMTYSSIGKNFKESAKNYAYSFGIFFCFTVIAQILNVILHYGAGGIDFLPPEGYEFKHSEIINYNDPDCASLFYISPFFRSNMPVYSLIWEKCGRIVNYILYVLSFFIIGAIVLGAIILIKKYYNKIKFELIKKKENKGVANE